MCVCGSRSRRFCVLTDKRTSAAAAAAAGDLVDVVVHVEVAYALNLAYNCIIMLYTTYTWGSRNDCMNALKISQNCRFSVN